MSLLTAAEKKLPLRMLTQGVSGEATKADAWGALLVAEDSGIRSGQDLEGKTVAVNTINNVPHMVVLRSLQKAGADWRRVKFIEVGFAEANAALEAGRVDAAWMVEPFVTNAQNAGSRVLLTPYIDTAPDLTVSPYFTSHSYIDSNPDVVERFTRAMNRSLECAQTHPDEVRRIVTTYTEIPKEAAAKMKLPVWHADMNVPTIELTARLSREYGFLEEAPDLATLIHEPGEGGTLFVNVTDDNELEIAPPGQEPFRQRCADGQTAYWEVGAEPGPAYTHTLRNVGARTHRQILVELLGPSASQESTGRPETNGRCA